MKALYELKEKFEMELEELARKGELGAGDLELAHKLTDTIKNIDKICALEDDEGYIRAGDWEADMRGTYGRGSSYRGRKRDSMGRYSRDGRMDGYSHHNARESMMELAREMMENTSSEREREAIRRFMTELERD
mgnify:FL=1